MKFNPRMVKAKRCYMLLNKEADRNILHSTLA